MIEHVGIHVLELVLLGGLVALVLGFRRRPVPQDRLELQVEALPLAVPQLPCSSVSAVPRSVGHARQEIPDPGYLKALFECSAAGMLVLDDRAQIIDVNAALCQIFGYPPEELIGQPASLLHCGERPFKPFRNALQAAADERSFARTDHLFRRKDGTRVWGQLLGASLVLPDGAPGMVWNVVDVTALREAQDEVHWQALHDRLTGMPNRRALEQQLPKAIARARRHDAVLAVGVIDLDDFKPVNDTWGHEAGDRLLKVVAGRLRERLRESDLLVRSGGDEFVVVIEDLDAVLSMQQLGELLTRLHGAVESPVEIGPKQFAVVGASLGLALYPFDAQDADALLRQADAAMYQAKSQKHARGQWWHHGGGIAVLPEPEPAFEPYGEQAARLLEKARDHFEAVLEQFQDVFWNQLAGEDSPAAVMAQLSAQEVRRLTEVQARYLRFLFDPATTEAAIVDRAARTGTVHALAGVGSEMLVQSLALHRRLLGDHLSRALLPARERYRILLCGEARMQDAMQSELRSLSSTQGAYLSLLSAPLPLPGSLWPDASGGEITRLGQLPGVIGALLLRLNAEGVFNVEVSAGVHGAEIATVLHTPGAEAVVHTRSERGQGMSAQAWRSREIQSTANYGEDPRYQHWHGAARAIGLRSALSLPVLNALGQPVAMLSLFGAYPNQFESTAMQQFARGLQQRWQQLWQQCTTPTVVIPQALAQEYRNGLFNGGLRMYVQPLVDLRTGRLAKVEALARLERADGSVLPPASFLPLLGDSELDRLFCLGLDLVLAQLRDWESEGLVIDAAVNLSPGTLLDPDCPTWVADALRRHGIAPARLTLELLETGLLEANAQDAAIGRLLALGIRLSMDDLGAGHNNLWRMTQLPFDTIKIDQALLAGVLEQPLLMLSLMRAIVQMGRDIDRAVVVEGLEHPDSIEAAAILGAHYGQGYALARPMPMSQVLAWSRSFRLPGQQDLIATALGALAQVWRCAQSDRRQSADAGACPLGGFLERHGADHPELLHWHQELHAGPDPEHAGRELRSWLAARVRGARTA